MRISPKNDGTQNVAYYVQEISYILVEPTTLHSTIEVGPLPDTPIRLTTKLSNVHRDTTITRVSHGHQVHRVSSFIVVPLRTSSMGFLDKNRLSCSKKIIKKDNGKSLDGVR